MSALAAVLTLVSVAIAEGRFHPQVAAGRYFSLFLEPSDNKVFGAGRNDHGQLGIPDASVQVPTQIVFPNATLTDNETNSTPGPPKVVAAAAGAFHSIFLTEDGEVFVTGRNHYGQLADPSGAKVTEPTNISFPSRVLDVAAGYAHSLFLTEDGLYGAGRNSEGQLGLGDTAKRTNVTFINLTECGGCRIESIAAGYDTSFALIEDGSVWAFGNNIGGQLGIGLTGSLQMTPARVKQSGGAYTAIAAGESHTLFQTRDAIYATGANFAGQLGEGSMARQAEPVVVSFSEDVTAVVAGGDSSCIIGGNDKEIYGFGSNLDGQIGLGDAKFSPTQPTKATVPSDAGRFRRGSLSDFHGLYIGGGAVVFASGANAYGQLATNSTNATRELVKTQAALTEIKTTTTTMTSTTSTTTTTETNATTTAIPIANTTRQIQSEETRDWTLIGWVSGISVTALALIVGFVAQGQAAKFAAEDDDTAEDVEMTRNQMST